MKGWLKIYSSQYMHKIEIIRSILSENDIECVIMNKQDSSYLFGEIELYVQDFNVIKAKQLLKEISNE